ncbi:hypothetical protein [Nocardioides renjunii]|uniref:hypothetical protein n=1 Tax=Nocardioides renjunii TaxID=3095075 RepID=UPI002AFE6ECC|nr:hypothetical protein [Nocardioides sp. S-34]WQQ22761.1 hypothetical protein SHK17_02010 [Nocardioides sp. S-34]
MSPGPDVSSLRRRLELGRLVIGSLVELGIKAYGAGAALSVAVSDAETVGGKGQDALAAVPNLVDRYRAAEYVVEHRQEIQAALDYVNENTPPQAELEDAAARSSETLRDIETTSDEVDAALGSFDGISPFNAFDRSQDALGHVRAAWGSKPDIESLRDLADRAEQVSPYVDQVEVLVPVYYGGLFAVVDNFASDEIASTLFVMAAALGVAFVLGQAVGFWVRRGRPGLIARTLQRWGAQTFPRWYVRNLPYALSPPLYAAARERMQRDIVADPEEALDPETLRELEQWFADRPKDDATP